MSVSGISSSYNPYQLGATSALQQQFQQLGQALQSGNLSASQSDFASLRAAFSQPATSTGAAASSSTSSPISQALNQLSSDLQSGNLTAAQKDYSTVHQDLQGTHGTVARHHHLGGGVGSSIDSLLQELSQTGQSSSSSSLSAAQQGYTRLQQQLQQFALGGAALASESAISFDA